MRRRSPRSKPSALPSSHDGGGSRGGEAGFTLVEILVALTLLGLVVAVLAGGLRLGIRVWEAEGARSEELSETQTVHAFLRRLIQQAYPYHEDADGNVAFEGRGDGLSLVAPLPSHVGYGGFHRIEIAAIGDRRERQLVLRHVLLHPDVDPRTTDESVSGETVLLSGIDAVELAYFGADSLQAPRSWRKEWKNQVRLPDLVRLNVRFRESGTRLWPSLVAAPMSSLEILCIREPNDSRCRRALFGE